MPVTNGNWIRRLLALVLLATAWSRDVTAGDAAAVGATLAADGRLDKPRRMLAEFGAEKMPWTQLPSPWDPLYHVWGFEGLLVACADRPELVEYACRRVAECTRRRIAS